MPTTCRPQPARVLPLLLGLLVLFAPVSARASFESAGPSAADQQGKDDAQGKKQKKNRKPKAPPKPEKKAVEEPAEEPPAILFLPRGETITDGVRAALDRYDPARSGWRSEAMYELAKHELEEFLGVISSPTGRARIDWYLASDFEGSTALVPEKLATLYDDGAMLVLGDGILLPELHPAEELGVLFAELMAPFQVDSRRGWKVYGGAKIYSTDIEPGYPRRFETRVSARFIGRTEDESYCQINTEWDLKWSLVDTTRNETAVRLRGIALRAYQQTQSQARIFSELTQALLSEIPRYEAEFLLGSGEYQFRTDAMEGNVFSGRSGIAVGDVNGDGREDIFVPQHGGLPNRLLLQGSKGNLVDVSEKAGLDLLDESQSALILDLDNDGDQDLAVARFNTLLIYENDGRGRFQPHQGGVAVESGKITSLSAADWDQDGDLDIYACLHDERGPLSTIPVPYHDAANGPSNVAWRNDGIAQWVDVTEALGFSDNDAKFSSAAVWDDFDRDGDPDLYVVNDFGRNNFYRNDGGHFSDVARSIGVDDMASGMGVFASDVNRDGWIDLYVSNMWSSAGRRIASQADIFRKSSAKELGQSSVAADDYLRHARGNTLLLNRGDGTFRDASQESGAGNGGWAWGAIAIDFNNDGLADIYSPNGFLTGSNEDDL